MTVFDQRKKKILEDLDSDVPDLSPKGRPDEEIVELLELLNAHENYVSTSSCSGRAVVYLDADKKGEGELACGRWLMNRHKPLKENIIECTDDALRQILFEDVKIGEDWDSTVAPSRLVALKFEPLVICYVCTADLDCTCPLSGHTCCNEITSYGYDKRVPRIGNVVIIAFNATREGP